MSVRPRFGVTINIPESPPVWSLMLTRQSRGRQPRTGRSTEPSVRRYRWGRDLCRHTCLIPAPPAAQRRHRLTGRSNASLTVSLRHRQGGVVAATGADGAAEVTEGFACRSKRRYLCWFRRIPAVFRLRLPDAVFKIKESRAGRVWVVTIMWCRNATAGWWCSKSFQRFLRGCGQHGHLVRPRETACSDKKMPLGILR